MKVKTRADYRRRRHYRVRRKVHGTSERPRMAVYLSNRHIYVQFIDDDAARTLAAASTAGSSWEGTRSDAAAAKRLGEEAARRAREKGIERVVFDRGGFTYGGRMKVLAEAARKGGLRF